MAWILINGALAKIRRTSKKTRKEVAAKTKLNLATIRRHERVDVAAVALQEETVRAYCDAYEVEPEAFAKWSVEDASARKRRLARIPDPSAPALKTLAQRANHEVMIGAQDDACDIAGEMVPLVGNNVIREAMAAFGHYEGKRFVVEGLIDDTASIPAIAMSMAFGGRFGEGTRFRICREVRRGLSVYVTVFAPKLVDATALLECVRAARPVKLVVRVFVKPPDEIWKGFFIFEKRPTPYPWCFVVDAILPPEESHG